MPIHPNVACEVANLLVIGVPKAGTSSLFTYLSHHPAVCPADVKETRYLNPLRHGKDLKPLDAWSKHWQRCGGERYLLEATPGYFYGGQPLATKLLELSPDARCVLILRAPEERCWSYYRFASNRVRIPQGMTFREYIDRSEREPVNGEESSAFRGVRGGEYATWLPEWLDVLGDRLRIIWFDDLVTDQQRVFADLLEWLDLDPIEASLEPENVTVGYRWRGVQRAAVAVNRAGERFFPRHPVLKRRLRSLYYRLNTGAMPRTMPDEDRDWLRTHYAVHNAALAKILTDRGMDPPPSSWTG